MDFNLKNKTHTMKITKQRAYTFMGITLVLVYLFMAMAFPKKNDIITVTKMADGDTFLSGWINIDGITDVALALSVSDSITAKAQVYWRFGDGDERQLLANDTLSAVRRTSATGIVVGKDYRGYNAHNPGANGQDTSLLVGAGQIQVRLTITDVATKDTVNISGNNRAKVGIITSD